MFLEPSEKGTFWSLLSVEFEFERTEWEGERAEKMRNGADWASGDERGIEDCGAGWDWSPWCLGGGWVQTV